MMLWYHMTYSPTSFLYNEEHLTEPQYLIEISRLNIIVVDIKYVVFL